MTLQQLIDSLTALQTSSYSGINIPVLNDSDDNLYKMNIGDIITALAASVSSETIASMQSDIENLKNNIQDEVKAACIDIFPGMITRYGLINDTRLSSTCYTKSEVDNKLSAKANTSVTDECIKRTNSQQSTDFNTLMNSYNGGVITQNNISTAVQNLGFVTTSTLNSAVTSAMATYTTGVNEFLDTVKSDLYDNPTFVSIDSLEDDIARLNKFATISDVTSVSDSLETTQTWAERADVWFRETDITGAGGYKYDEYMQNVYPVDNQ